MFYPYPLILGIAKLMKLDSLPILSLIQVRKEFTMTQTEFHQVLTAQSRKGYESDQLG
jgi:hypothetical protein